jgi:hypothetical protein
MFNNIRDLGLEISINNILYGHSDSEYGYSDSEYDVNCTLFVAVHRSLSLNIFYCQAIIDNGSDTSYKLTRSSPLHINH